MPLRCCRNGADYWIGWGGDRCGIIEMIVWGGFAVKLVVSTELSCGFSPPPTVAITHVEEIYSPPTKIRGVVDRGAGYITSGPLKRGGFQTALCTNKTQLSLVFLLLFSRSVKPLWHIMIATSVIMYTQNYVFNKGTSL